ncbi:MAG: hypothetical protein SOH86_06010 [Erysipelotrichaceae bacterium]|jgi:hypothetical protein
MRKLGTIIFTLFLAAMPLPVLAEESSDAAIPAVFGILALVGLVVFLILGLTVTIVAHNTDENQDGL